MIGAAPPALCAVAIALAVLASPRSRLTERELERAIQESQRSPAIADRIRSRLAWYVRAWCDTSVSQAAMPACCTMLGAQTNVNCCSFVISSMSRAGPCAKPSRQPVIACDLLKPSITSTSSSNSAGLANGPSKQNVR